jgi:hypothetical protein
MAGVVHLAGNVTWSGDLRATPSEDTEDAPPADLRAAVHLPDERRGVLRRLGQALAGPGDRAPDAEDEGRGPGRS